MAKYLKTTKTYLQFGEEILERIQRQTFFSKFLMQGSQIPVELHIKTVCLYSSSGFLQQIVYCF